MYFRLLPVIVSVFISLSLSIYIYIYMSTQNYTTPDDDQKYGRKWSVRRYGTIPLPSSYRYKNYKETWKMEWRKINSFPPSLTKLARIITSCLNIHSSIYIYIYIYILVKIVEGPKRERNILKWIGPRKYIYFLRFIYLFHSYIRVFFHLVAFVREQIWHQALWMGYSLRLELARVWSLNDFHLVIGVYIGYSFFFLFFVRV